jgi:secreted trypsin-like serine protease
MGGRGCKKILAPGGEFVAGGTGTADSCFGDSGGPVYLDTPNGTVVIASVSRGVDGAQTPCGGGGIYVRTDKVIEWIEETTGRTVAKDECLADEDCTDETGDDYASTTGNPDEVGCNAGGAASGLGTLLLLAAGIVIGGRRRARRAPGLAWGQSLLEQLSIRAAH